jgi:hypothetical protein
MYQVYKVGEHEFEVEKEDGTVYHVNTQDDTCDCPSYKSICKHLAVCWFCEDRMTYGQGCACSPALRTMDFEFHGKIKNRSVSDTLTDEELEELWIR